MNYGSVCSGIEAASVAWEPLGWKPAWFSEIEPFPCSLLSHHYPGVPNFGDMTKFQDWPENAAIDLLVGGTPCQSFSVAGLRAGLADPRGNLALTYLAIAAKYRPRWVLWENVPGVLSSNGGRDFGSFLGGLVKLGYGVCYRVLDAQFCRASGFPNAVPQRRRRVFVVGYFGDWRPAAAVLFDGAGLRGDPPPRRQAGQKPAGTISSRTSGGGGLGTDFELDGGLVTEAVSDNLAVGANQTTGCKSPSIVASAVDVAWCLTAGGGMRLDPETETMVAHALRGEGFDASEDGTGRGTPLVPLAFGHQNSAHQGISASSEITPTLDKSKTPAVAYPINTQIAMRHEALGEGTGMGVGEGGDPSYTLQAGHSHAVGVGMAVRRLTPTECERLQGFPDGYTLVPHRGKPAADGPRYKALGNSMAVNVMRVLGERINLVDQKLTARRSVAA